MRLRGDDLFLTTVDDQTVLLDTRTSNYLTTNITGTALLTALQQEASVEQLVDQLAAQFGLNSVQARRDCETFLAQLRSHEFLVE